MALFRMGFLDKLNLNFILYLNIFLKVGPENTTRDLSKLSTPLTRNSFQSLKENDDIRLIFILVDQSSIGLDSITQFVRYRWTIHGCRQWKALGKIESL